MSGVQTPWKDDPARRPAAVIKIVRGKAINSAELRTASKPLCKAHVRGKTNAGRGRLAVLYMHVNFYIILYD